MRLSIISDDIEDLRDLVFDRGKKDSPKLGTMRIGKENDIWDSDERSLGCSILVKKGAVLRVQNLLNHCLLLNALINFSLKPFSGVSLQMESKTV